MDYFVHKSAYIDDGVFCGPSMVFTNVSNPRSFIERKQEFKKTLVRTGAILGANCTQVFSERTYLNKVEKNKFRHY